VTQQAVAQQAQTTATQAQQAVQVQAATPLSNSTPAESGQVVQQTPAQPRQDKPSEGLPTTQTQNNLPSAASERIELVSESRQNDSQQAGTGDPSQQQSKPTGTDALLQQSTLNTTGPGASQSAGLNPAASAVQTGAAPSIEQAPAPVSAQPSGIQQVKADAESNDRINTARIARGLQNAVQQKGGAVTLRLTPPEMGTVRIQLQIQNGTVNAQFHAENPATRTLLNQQIAQLRTSLEHQGLSVDRLSVQTMQQSSNTNLQNESQSDRDGQPDDGRSRGGFTRQGGDRQQGPDDRQSQEEFDKALSQAA
jgi:flagellar hook-length control protein FliK